MPEISYRANGRKLIPYRAVNSPARNAPVTIVMPMETSDDGLVSSLRINVEVGRFEKAENNSIYDIRALRENVLPILHEKISGKLVGKWVTSGQEPQFRLTDPVKQEDLEAKLDLLFDELGCDKYIDDKKQPPRFLYGHGERPVRSQEIKPGQSVNKSLFHR